MTRQTAVSLEVTPLTAATLPRSSLEAPESGQTSPVKMPFPFGKGWGLIPTLVTSRGGDLVIEQSPGP